jgi:AcrR family transcriptional regulator
MPRAVRPYHHGDLRNALLDEAAKVIELEGVAALTLRELARRLAVSHAAPTNHFADKDALLVELAAQGFEELALSLDSARRGRAPATALREISRAYVAFARRRPGHYRVMFGRGLSRKVSSPRLEEQGQRAYEVLVRTVLAALPPGHARSPRRVREASFLAWSVVHGASMLLLDAPLPPELAASSDDETMARLVDHATASVAAIIRGSQ